ncbi:MAG: asparagine synthase (glutamine-hydrolyzing) [Epulopiscium sp. Nele67-Bin004]|nr:MAG: asparagine synthase (glutamine-hydrolyzing) [Epulopiscium sp. Nele67-Bin004]
MCSICGILDFKTSTPVDKSVIDKMGNTMTHRGPDQKGLFIDKGVALQHNRLSIMDPKNGLQPMTRTYDGKTYTIIYNGEIYNTPQLRKEIEAQGVVLQTNCDTEVVLYTYILWGEDCSSKLNGIFAFVIYNEAIQKVYISRDRFGVKPFFYSLVGSSFIFGSEIKSLLAHPDVKPVIDKTGLWQLLFLAPMKLCGTGIFRDVLEIPPATHGYFDEDGLHIEKYWELKAKPFTGTAKDAIEETKQILSDAIKTQLVSDVPLCTFLSGGIDSSIISSVASQEYKGRGETLSTFSFEYLGNKENFKDTLFQPEADDAYALYLANYLGTHHTVLTATTPTLVDYLEEATFARDLPGMADIDSSLLFYCREVKKTHTVALSGECADEIFGGYPWFYRPEMLSTNFYPWIHDPFKRVELFRDDIVNSKDGYAYLSEKYLADISNFAHLDSDSEIMLRSRKATHLSTKYFMTSLLERKDRMSMASGVEVRVPFSDHRVLEHVYNVPWEIKFAGDVEKSLLREAMAEYLPDKILHRKKSPYPKTHDPMYEKKVTELLRARLADESSILAELINVAKLEDLFSSKNATWFGQLMSKPQLISWLLQLDYWFTDLGVTIE